MSGPTPIDVDQTMPGRIIRLLRQAASQRFSNNSIRSNAVQIYAIQILTLTIGLGGGIIIARVLGPSEKGHLNLFGVLSSFINDIGLLGIGSGFLFYLANKKVQIERVHGSVAAYALLAGLVTVIIGFVGLPLWRQLLPGLQDWMLVLPFLLAPITYYLNLWPSIMLGIDQAVSSNRLGLATSTLTLVAIAGLWLSGGLNTVALIWATSAISVVMAGVAFSFLFRRTPRLQPDYRLTKDSLTYGSIIFVATIANVVHFKIDQVMVNYWLGPAAVGIYAVSVSWAEKLFLLDTALLSAALYRISSSSSEDSVELTNRVFRAQLTISGVGGVALALVAFPLVLILYGEAYRASVVPLVLLIPGIIAWSSARVHSNMLVYNRGLGAYVMRAAVLGSIVNIALNFVGLGLLHAGIASVAIVSSISYLLVAISIYLKSRSYRVP